MYRKGRAETTKRCVDIVNNNKIRTQTEFALKYYELYGENISQTTVHRMFENANIRINHATGFYEHFDKDMVSKDSIKQIQNESELFDLLDLHSYGLYTHEQGVKMIYLSVDFSTEQMIASSIYDFCDRAVTILLGFGCLLIRCHTVEKYQKLRAVIKQHKK